jgi:hypothetical protein
MPILNYTTTISVQKTAGEIQEILSKADVKSVKIDYGSDHVPEAISFQIMAQGRLISFRLPSQWRGVYRMLIKDEKVERRFRNEEQARRVAWRIIKDMIEAQVAAIEAEAADLAEVFLPYMVNPETNETLYEDFKNGFLLGPGTPVDGEVKDA